MLASLDDLLKLPIFTCALDGIQLYTPSHADVILLPGLLLLLMLSCYLSDCTFHSVCLPPCSWFSLFASHFSSSFQPFFFSNVGDWRELLCELVKNAFPHTHTPFEPSLLLLLPVQLQPRHTAVEIHSYFTTWSNHLSRFFLFPLLAFFVIFFFLLMHSNCSP